MVLLGFDGPPGSFDPVGVLAKAIGLVLAGWVVLLVVNATVGRRVRAWVLRRRGGEGSG